MTGNQAANKCLRIKLSSLSCQCGPKELPKPRPSAARKNNAAVDLGPRESD